MPAPPPARVTAQDRARRRLRIFARMQQGCSYETIAQEEHLSRERVRQIVKETLDERKVDPTTDHTRLQLARLDPALKIVAEKVAEGDLKAVDRLLRILDKMDKYQSSIVLEDNPEESDDDARERILKILSDVDERRRGYEEDEAREQAEAEAEEARRAEAAHNDVAKFFQR
jgi:intein/homing endonuclease